ncbi:hypothetical protein BGW36DRAFT_286534 [Talaromyces proteolyticus]|uniref:Uncharacterized protein n=1 Tax=Talaromyces proteolyticus TaxID=1131652 RepID=A0AAD4L486_9EURO|nr:uncharacterized protein BGW36DRAFT_286534 [Talaromyces proteolyticus]KAH8705667.1 hypothetical protein BGW36DRAFT_286534 [Talaromyces proteolyticus]
MRTALEHHPVLKKRLHIAIGTLVSITFIPVIARLADKGTSTGRMNTWGIAACLKSGVFLAYQVLTTHVDRFKKRANTKTSVTLNIINTMFWFALIIITILGTIGETSTSSHSLRGLQ